MHCFIFFSCVSQAETLSETVEGINGLQKELRLAAAHIDDALKGRGAYGKARAIFKSDTLQR